MLICQLTDLHVATAGVGKRHVSDTTGMTERALRCVAALSPAPDVVVITGDLTEHGSTAEYRQLADLLRRYVKSPVFVIPGNHDDRAALRAELPSYIRVSPDQETLSYVVDEMPVRLVMLDTLVVNEDHGFLSDSQLSWLDTAFGAGTQKPTLVAMHHPPILTGIRHMDAIGLLNAPAFRDVVSRHTQVQRIICGHHHRPVVGSCAQAIASIAPSVAHQIALSFDPAHGGAFTFEPPALELHLWNETAGFVSHTVYTGLYDGPYPFT
jgi:3',5'-cyclic-AMP phosphodiesterase